ncbi:winged helix-turn-helix transcriptional regulator [Candidatus Bathyarchaeota archaeon]|nr:winged helix-turn-helix transcriptional regulator [Candidatus Bathyarchaeota archaeon]
MNVEDVFSSRLRIKIVKILMQMSELNISEIARRLGINHNAASRHLQVLEDEGILQQKVFGRIRLYRIKENSLKAKAIQNLIETWES